MMSDARRGGDAELEQAIAVVRSLPEIMPQDADATVREIYEDVQNTLRVPFVNQLFRLLASNSDYLQAAWRYVGPIAETRAFEDASTALREVARPDFAMEAADAEWTSLGDLDRVRRFTESIHYVLPKLLLAVTLLDPAIRGTDGERARGSETFPKGVAAGTEKIEMVDPEAADEPLRSLFADIRERHRHPALATYFRSLGQWPELLKAIWTRLAPHVGGRGHEARKAALIDRAGELAAGLRTEDERPPNLPEPAAAVLAVFRLRVIPDLLVDVAIVRAMLDGPEAARTNRFVVK
ncbi:halocarboxylic acid dehydrogenase DehI family protein [Palleronia sp.]|uniref:halocarboxylic acid dehydrogenase DehI family protein n=1 Tax=Palleronia sp. TaxID=1940284 RepID=UPI0035C85AB4